MKRKLARDRVRVLMIGPSFDAQGGIASVIDGYLKGGLVERADVIFVPTMEDGGIFHKVSFGLAAFVKYSKLLSSVDVVHVHISNGMSFWRKSVFVKMAYHRGVPVILHSHDGMLKETFAKASDKKRRRITNLFVNAAKVIVLSEEWRDFFAENICDSDQIVVVHNAVPLPEESVNVASNQDILFLGRLDENKSPDVLLRAFAKIAKCHPRSRVIFAGSAATDDYESLAYALGVVESCEFKGWVAGSEKRSLLSRAGVYCLPSKNEGMPMSLLEAMSLGIPPVATEVGGVPQAINNGVNGYLVQVDDVKAISKALDNLLSSSELRVSMGEAARRTIADKFSVDASIDRLIKVYENV